MLTIFSMFFLISYFCDTYSQLFITNHLSKQLGDNIALFSISYLLARQYSLPFIYRPFKYSHLFKIDDLKDAKSYAFQGKKTIEVNSFKVCQEARRNAFIDFNYDTDMGPINPNYVKELKALVQFKNPPAIKLPKDKVTIAVHIRKGNGGGELFDGVLLSKQYYETAHLPCVYVYDYYNFPFEWELPLRNANDRCVPEWSKYLGDQHIKYDAGTALDKIHVWCTKFPPEQYYVDQLNKIVHDLDPEAQYYVQLFTDDKDPHNLLERIRMAAHQPNISFYYRDNRNESFEDRIVYDLYAMARFDILIRSQSYFARAAELIGDHKLIIHPLTGIWIDGILFMNYVAIKGSLSSLEKTS